MSTGNRKSIRLQGYDYGQDGYYAVTLVTKYRRRWLSRIVDAEVRLTREGEILMEEWKKTAELRANVHLDEFIIMPDHVHAIIRIGNPIMKNGSRSMKEFTWDFENGIRQAPVNNLGSIVGGLKRVCTKRIREFNPDFAWVRNYYERVMRNQEELDAMRKYIRRNPAKWR